LPSGSPTRHTSPRNGLRDPDRGAPVRAGAKAAGEAAARIVEHLTHLDAPREELVAGRVHVVQRHEQGVVPVAA
jgi:hypothetical protein